MNQRQYIYVSTLADELSFSHAAEELGITQPTLSQFIKKIETEIGTELFSRNGSEVELTEAGHIYLEFGKKMMNLQHNMDDALLDISEYKTGKIRIALSPCRCDTIMPEAVNRFRLKYPGIEVSIQEMLAGGLLRGIQNDDFDIGVTPMPQDKANVICEPIIQEEILLAVPRKSNINKRLKENAVNKPGYLYSVAEFRLMDRMPFVVMQEWQVMQKQLISLCEICGITVTPVVECTNNRTMIMMVQYGVGSTLIPSSIIRYDEKEKYDNVVLYSINPAVPIREIVSIYRKDKKLSKPAQYMLKILKNEENGHGN